MYQPARPGRIKAASSSTCPPNPGGPQPGSGLPASHTLNCKLRTDDPRAHPPGQGTRAPVGKTEHRREVEARELGHHGSLSGVPRMDIEDPRRAIPDVLRHRQRVDDPVDIPGKPKRHPLLRLPSGGTAPGRTGLLITAAQRPCWPEQRAQVAGPIRPERGGIHGAGRAGIRVRIGAVGCQDTVAGDAPGRRQRVGQRGQLRRDHDAHHHDRSQRRRHRPALSPRVASRLTCHLLMSQLLPPATRSQSGATGAINRHHTRCSSRHPVRV